MREEPRLSDYSSASAYVIALNTWMNEVRESNRKDCSQIDRARDSVQRGNRWQAPKSRDVQTIHDAAMTNPFLRYILKREEYYTKCIELKARCGK